MNKVMQRDLISRIKELSVPVQPRPTDTVPRIEPVPGIRAVLFDIYGTLVISASGDIGLAGERDEERAFVAAREAAGIEPGGTAGPERLRDAIRKAHAEHKAAGVDHPEVEILSIWSALLPTEADRLLRLSVEYECRVNPVWPMPGLAECLSELKRRGLVLGIVSNAQFYTPLMLEAFLGAPLADLGFDPECCAWSYRLLEAKPSTRIYRDALCGLEESHGIAPDGVLYVGNDIRNDIWPASLTGCRTVLFAGDARSLRLREDDPRCAHVRADRVVTDLRQITGGILAPGFL